MNKPQASLEELIDAVMDVGSLSHDQTNCSVTNKHGEQVSQWNDDAHFDYPEDLTWDRMAFERFTECYQAGARSQAVLGEALKEALTTLRFINESSYGNLIDHTLKNIRRILEGEAK